MSISGGVGDAGAGVLALRLRDLAQLFNSLDPSPFHEKDLDPAAREYLIARARDEPPDTGLRIVVEVEHTRSGEDTAAIVREALHNDFSYQADLRRRELVDLFRQGRIALTIGVLFLGVCLFAAQALESHTQGPTRILRESLVIVGWVAMWRPLEIFLYDWWPLARRIRLLMRLATCQVELRRLSLHPPGPLAQSVRADDS